VEAWQHVKLTSTNCSIGLIAGRLQDLSDASPTGNRSRPITAAYSGKVRRHYCPTNRLWPCVRPTGRENAELVRMNARGTAMRFRACAWTTWWL
jgi:hypothetical protein